MLWSFVVEQPLCSYSQLPSLYLNSCYFPSLSNQSQEWTIYFSGYRSENKKVQFLKVSIFPFLCHCRKIKWNICLISSNKSSAAIHYDLRIKLDRVNYLGKEAYKIVFNKQEQNHVGIQSTFCHLFCNWKLGLSSPTYLQVSTLNWL